MNLDTKWLGQVAYREAYALQLKLREERRAGLIGDMLLLLEHPPTFTLGRRDCEADFLQPVESLAASGYDIIKVERGGRVTYHGPGQLVGYLICDLKQRALSVPDFVERVERGLQTFLCQHGITAQLKQGCPGLWVEERKIVSLGFHIERGISIHGFAINIFCDLSPFKLILPCGHQCEMTSIQQEINKVIPLDSLTYSINMHIKRALETRGCRSQNSDTPSWDRHSCFRAVSTGGG